MRRTEPGQRPLVVGVASEQVGGLLRLPTGARVVVWDGAGPPPADLTVLVGDPRYVPDRCGRVVAGAASWPG